MKKYYKYIIILVLFMVLVASITFSYVYVHYKEQGSVEVIKKYSEVIYNNVIIDYESGMSAKIEDNKVHIEIPKLSKNKPIEFSFDMINIGNINLISENYSITNVNTNIDEDDIIIVSSLKSGQIIKGGENKKVIVKIEYNGNDTIDEKYFSFNINYSFKEVVL